jgi:hypothetical protein
LYLIKDIREGVLNAPPSPLLHNNQRAVLDFTPMVKLQQTRTASAVVPVVPVVVPVVPVVPVVVPVVVGDEEGHAPVALPVAALVQKTQETQETQEIRSEASIVADGAGETKTNVNDPMELLNQKVEVEWASHQWYKGTVKLYDSYTGKYTVQYDDGEVVALDPCQGRPRKELPYRMCLIQNEMNEQEAAQNVLEQTRKVFRFLQDSQRSSYDPKGTADTTGGAACTASKPY